MKVLIERTGLSKSFNRYIVECECYPRGLSVHLRCVLIDTWWNVNEWYKKYGLLGTEF